MRYKTLCVVEIDVDEKCPPEDFQNALDAFRLKAPNNEMDEVVIYRVTPEDLGDYLARVLEHKEGADIWTPVIEVEDGK